MAKVSTQARVSPVKKRGLPKDDVPSFSVQAALEGYESGHLHQYRALIAALVVPRGPLQCEIYNQASRCVSLISPDHKELVQAFWLFDWGANEATIKAYANFLVHLVSAHGSKFLVRVLKALIGRLKLKPFGEVEGFDEAAVQRCSLVIHPSLQKILTVVPGSHEQLGTAIIENFPHLSHSLVIQKLFLENVLQILEYCPLIRERIIPSVIDRLLRIDVEIKLDDIQDGDSDEGEDTAPAKQNVDDDEGMFGMEMEGQGHATYSSQLSPEEEQRVKEHRENAAKLDYMLDLLILHFQHRTQPERDEYFKILVPFFDHLRAFDSIVLNTHECKYTQFIYFYFAQLHPQFSASFLTYLTSHLDGSAQDQHLPANKNRRLTAVAYIGSFVGRAAFLAPAVVRECLSYLVRWLHAYLDRYEYEIARTLSIAADAERHGLFYLVTQAVLYGFCFKFRVIAEDQGGLENMGSIKNRTTPFKADRYHWINSLRLERVVESALNPLIMIQKQVAEEFSNITVSLGIPIGGLCERVLQRNKLIILPTRASFGGENRLETFFPFDPFMLKMSSKHFKEGYQYWSSVLAAEADEELESSESVHGTPTTDGVPINKRLRSTSNAMQIARSLEDGGFSLSYSNSYNPDADMAISYGAPGNFGSFGDSNSQSVGYSDSPVYQQYSPASFL